jgi:hypothetical protein
MTDKKELIQYEPLYWAYVRPVPKEMILNRYQVVRSDYNGFEIGTLGNPTHVIIDTNENEAGNSRIIAVLDTEIPPVPRVWIARLYARGMGNPQLHQWWTDNTGLSPVPPGMQAEEIDFNITYGAVSLHGHWDQLNGGLLERIS